MHVHTWVHVYMYKCICILLGLLFVSGAIYSSTQFSLCFARLGSAVNFNDTSIKIGADVSQLAESQIEESERRRLSNIECTQATERNLELCTVSICSSVIQDRTVIYSKI